MQLIFDSKIVRKVSQFVFLLYKKLCRDTEAGEEVAVAITGVLSEDRSKLEVTEIKFEEIAFVIQMSKMSGLQYQSVGQYVGSLEDITLSLL